MKNIVCAVPPVCLPACWFSVCKMPRRRRVLRSLSKAVPVAGLKIIWPPPTLFCSAPQVKMSRRKLQALADPFGKKVAVIDMMDYGMMKVMPFWIKPLRCWVIGGDLETINHGAAG